MYLKGNYQDSFLKYKNTIKFLQSMYLLNEFLSAVYKYRGMKMVNGAYNLIIKLRMIKTAMGYYFYSLEKLWSKRWKNQALTRKWKSWNLTHFRLENKIIVIVISYLKVDEWIKHKITTNHSTIKHTPKKIKTHIYSGHMCMTTHRMNMAFSRQNMESIQMSNSLQKD